MKDGIVEPGEKTALRGFLELPIKAECRRQENPSTFRTARLDWMEGLRGELALQGKRLLSHIFRADGLVVADWVSDPSAIPTSNRNFAKAASAKELQRPGPPPSVVVQGHHNLPPRPVRYSSVYEVEDILVQRENSPVPRDTDATEIIEISDDDMELDTPAPSPSVRSTSPSANDVPREASPEIIDLCTSEPEESGTETGVSPVPMKNRRKSAPSPEGYSHRAGQKRSFRHVVPNASSDAENTEDGSSDDAMELLRRPPPSRKTLSGSTVVESHPRPLATVTRRVASAPSIARPSNRPRPPAMEVPAPPKPTGIRAPTQGMQPPRSTTSRNAQNIASTSQPAKKPRQSIRQIPASSSEASSESDEDMSRDNMVTIDDSEDAPIRPRSRDPTRGTVPNATPKKPRSSVGASSQRSRPASGSHSASSKPQRSSSSADSAIIKLTSALHRVVLPKVVHGKARRLVHIPSVSKFLWTSRRGDIQFLDELSRTHIANLSLPAEQGSITHVEDACLIADDMVVLGCHSSLDQAQVVLMEQRGPHVVSLDPRPHGVKADRGGISSLTSLPSSSANIEFASGGYDHRLYRWFLERGENDESDVPQFVTRCAPIVVAHTSTIISLASSRSKRWILTSALDKRVNIIDEETEQPALPPLRFSKTPHQVHSHPHDPSIMLLEMSDGSIPLFDLRKLRAQKDPEVPRMPDLQLGTPTLVYPLMSSRPTRYSKGAPWHDLFAQGGPEGIKLWDVRKNTQTIPLSGRNTGTHVCFTDMTLLAAGENIVDFIPYV